jgi:excinuclease ABC subunit C
MQQSAEKLEFEKAARLRDQIQYIEQFQFRQKMVLPDPCDRDIIGLATNEDAACAAVFRVRDGRILGKQHFYLNGVAEEKLSSVLSFFLKQYYLKSDFLPEEIFLPEPVEEHAEIETWLKEKFNQKVRLIVPKIGEKAQLVSMATKNAGLQLGELILQKQKSKDFLPNSVQALQRDLNLKTAPRYIEAFDISNIQGTDPVASMVAFKNGQPYKPGYRRFKIRGKASPDDFAMMSEVVLRRYRRAQSEKQLFPDLILIDGGKGQLGAALKSLNDLGVANQPIIALAKRLDEVFVPGISEPQNLPRASAGLHLLQRVRDESHRFAITFHRQLRSKRTITSLLDQIPGVGKQRRDALLKHFGSVTKIKSASIADLEKVSGIPKPLAAQIHRFFNPNAPANATG